MTDRELLEAAARAAGVNWTRWVSLDGGMHGLLLCDRLSAWNPLESDADAFRLAAALGLIVEFDGRGIRARAVPGSGPCASASAIARTADEHLILVRRAITRVAAALAQPSNA